MKAPEKRANSTKKQTKRGAQINPISMSFKKNEKGKIRFIALLSTLIILFSLTLAHNSTSDPVQENPTDIEEPPEETETDEIKAEPEIPESKSQEESSEQTREETKKENTPEKQPERKPTNETQEQPQNPDNSSEPETPGKETNITLPPTKTPENNSVPRTQPNITIPPSNNSKPENSSGNKNITTNQSIPNPTNNTNFTRNQSQNPRPNQTTNPVMSLEIIGEDKITRGITATYQAVVINGGSTATNVSINWILPENFKVLSEENSFCGTLGKDENCTSKIHLEPSLETSLGGIEINAEVSYSD